MGEKKRKLAAARAGIAQAAASVDPDLAAARNHCEQLQRQVAARPHDHAAWYQLSISSHLLAVLGKEQQQTAELVRHYLNQALDAITQAIEAQPGNAWYWMHFSECLKLATLSHPLADQAHELLQRALEHPSVDPASLAGALVSLLNSQPEMQAIAQQADAADPIEPGAVPALLDRVAALLREPLLLRLLQLCIVAAPEMESLITLTRRALLRDVVNRWPETAPLPLHIMAAIAHQCFATEYVYDESHQERDDLDSLQRAIEARQTGGAPVPAHWYATLACFRPLHRVLSIERAVGDADSALAGLIRSQVMEPAEERALCAAIPRTGVPAGPVSTEVGLLYEDNPYPRWNRCVLAPSGAGFAETIAQFLPGVRVADADSGSRRILIAGCGTGLHSIQTASRFPDARVLAVDLSLNSLAYAMRKTQTLGIGNIDYRQHDILQLGSLSERFDLIESIGVLHHLAEPLQGWRVLRNLLKPRGLMRIGLYSATARNYLKPFQESVKARRLRPLLDDIRQLRAGVRPMFAEDPLLALARSPDFYCASGCRDMFFHVMEHCYTPRRLRVELESLNLAFLGFQLPTVALGNRYRAQFPDDPAMRDLEHWQQFETANPWMFQGMYIFWAQAQD